MTEENTPKIASDPHVFQDRNHVPAPWRQYRGGDLQLGQINALIKRGHDLGHWQEHPNGDTYYVPDEGRARAEFEAQNELVNGQWVPRAKA